MGKIFNFALFTVFISLKLVYCQEAEKTTNQRDVLTGDEDTPQQPPDDPALIELKAKAFLAEAEQRQSEDCNKVHVAEWNFSSNITDENQKKALEAALAHAKFKKDLWKQVIAFPWKNFKDPYLRRQFKSLSNLGTNALPEDKLEKFTKLVSDMKSKYSKAKVCRFKDANKCDLSLEPELTNILQTSRDYEELEHVWLKWREVSGNAIRDQYPQYVELLNEAARINGFKDGTEFWLDRYDTETLREDVQKLWEQLRPLYDQLHAYVRRQLRKQYGSSKISRDGAIPAHVLGNMWAQHWGNILNFTVPFPNKPSVDVSEAMVKQNYTVFDMFKESEKFFTSVGLPPMTPEFWANSIIEKPTDREIICHASAWDFCNGKDFRIKQCTEVKMKDLIVVHHEMGHVMYFMQYKDQPLAFRTGANPGFHEAVGDLMALSVSSPKHLKEIGLLENVEEDNELSINYLYSQALEKVAFIPFALLVDQFRWDIFSGKIKPEEYNCHYWKLRNHYQGIRPPVTRKSTDFDAGAKYHVPASVPYIRYFVSNVIQYQMYKSLCIAAGEYDPTNSTRPLHQCDFYRNKEAGKKLGNMLALGASKPWPEALEQVTGQKAMDASALVEYYKPLYEWLQEQNAKAEEHIGWKESGKQNKTSLFAFPSDFMEPDFNIIIRAHSCQNEPLGQLLGELKSITFEDKGVNMINYCESGE